MRSLCISAAAVVVLVLGTVTAAGAPRSVPMTAWFGALQVQPSQDAALKQLKVNATTVEIGWDRAQPGPATFDAAYLASKRTRIAALRAQGTYVVLDLGLQYPPSWVFDLPGGTRFVDQRGTAATGGPGSNIADAVFNTRVRAAQGTFLRRLADELAGSGIAAVRVGGMSMGELSYPAAPTADGPTMWMYSRSAQAGAPVPGWRPGTGTTSDARRSLGYYLTSIDGYARWLLAQAARGFPGTDLHLMLPSWGLRPGQVDAAVAGKLTGTTSGELTGAITQGLDWTVQTRLLTRYGSRGVAYSTWLDAPTQGTSPRYLSPIEYLSTLATPLGVALAGENTGGTDPASMQLCLQRVQSLHLRGMLWMTASDLLDHPQLAQQYARGVAAARKGE